MTRYYLKTDPTKWLDVSAMNNSGCLYVDQHGVHGFMLGGYLNTHYSAEAPRRQPKVGDVYHTTNPGNRRIVKCVSRHGIYVAHEYGDGAIHLSDIPAHWTFIEHRPVEVSDDVIIKACKALGAYPNIDESHRKYANALVNNWLENQE